jgi:hypothetical protein
MAVAPVLQEKRKRTIIRENFGFSISTKDSGGAS